MLESRREKVQNKIDEVKCLMQCVDYDKEQKLQTVECVKSCLDDQEEMRRRWLKVLIVEKGADSSKEPRTVWFVLVFRQLVLLKESLYQIWKTTIIFRTAIGIV